MERGILDWIEKQKTDISEKTGESKKRSGV